MHLSAEMHAEVGAFRLVPQRTFGNPDHRLRAHPSRIGDAQHRLCAAILPMAEANAAATSLGACIGCVRGDKLAIGPVDDVDGHVVGLAVCGLRGAGTAAPVCH